MLVSCSRCSWASFVSSLSILYVSIKAGWKLTPEQPPRRRHRFAVREGTSNVCKTPRCRRYCFLFCFFFPPPSWISLSFRLVRSAVSMCACLLCEYAKTQCSMFKHIIMPNRGWEGRKGIDTFFFFCLFLLLSLCACVCVFKKLDNVKCLKKKSFAKGWCEENLFSKWNPPRAMYNPQGCQAASRQGQARGGSKEGKEGRRGGKLAGDTLLLFNVQRKYNVTFCFYFSLDLTILWAKCYIIS